MANPSPEFLAGLKAVPGVASVEEDTDRLALRIHEDRLALEDLTAAIHGLGDRLQMFQPQAMDMETAFMKLTQGKVA